MLSREIGTKLTGRQLSFEVYPLSFPEYLRFKGIHIRSALDYPQDKTEHYLSAILESYLLFHVRKLAWSLKAVQRAYAIDTGLRNRVACAFSPDTGWLAENILYNQLRSSHDEVFFAANGTETDFIVKTGSKIASRIQVGYEDPDRTEIPARELAAFANPPTDGALGELGGPPAECLLLTNDIERPIQVGPTGVRCVPLVKYLLGLPAL